MIDAGASRARWIPESHNIPGFPHGIAGSTLLSDMKEQAVRYGADIRAGKIEFIEHCEGGFYLRLGSQSLFCRFVVLATGIQDHLPPLPGAEEAVLRSLLRICPICDGFEATGKCIAVIGSGPHGDREAQFLRTYSDRVTLIHIGTGRNRDADKTLREAGVVVIESDLTQLQIQTDRLVLRTAEGVRSFDVFYSALGCTPCNQLAVKLGATLDESGALRVNRHQQTSIPGLYAAGDVVRGLNQVVVAAADAAVAAVDIHNQLRDLESPLKTSHRLIPDSCSH
jgi:thioredoxin reductase (NADPH)